MKEFLLQQRLSKRTIVMYMYWINKFIDFGKGDISNRILAYKEYCMENYSIQTQKVILSALKYLIEYQDLNIKIKMPKSNWVLKGVYLSIREYKDIVSSIISNDYITSVRNKEIFKVLWKTGIRARELLELKWCNVENGFIRITSKNNKTRRIPYQENMFEIMKLYKKGEYIFHSVQGKKLSYSALYSIFKNIKHKKISPHAMRHSFATRLINNGVPLNIVSRLMGHSNINTTMAYLHFDDQKIIEILKEKDWN